MHKKIQYILLLMLFTCLISVTAKNKSRISLNDEWQFKQSISQNWLPAQVPGAVHTDLMPPHYSTAGWLRNHNGDS